MMKNIKELGLQFIELKDQVLLVDKKSKLLKGDWHIEKELIINQFPKYLTDLSECDKIIASTRQLEGLPLLVIEDEVDSLSKEAHKKHSVKDDRLSLDEQIQRTGGFNVGYKEGYNKAKETYKFTEEDICKFVEWMNLHYRTLEHTISFKGVEGTKELLALWLWETKKELYVEVEVVDQYKSTETRNKDKFEIPQIKTTDNKIKAVWK